MKVILLADIPHVGHEGDIIEVADGYHRNYLEPRKLAVRATSGAMKDLDNRRNAITRREEDKRVKAQDIAGQLQEGRIVVYAPTGEGTRLHGTVTAQQIAVAAAEQLNFDIDRRDIDIPEPIREIGDYLVTARVYKDVTAQLPVKVMPLRGEGEEEKEEVAAEAEEHEPEAEEEAGEVEEETEEEEAEEEAEQEEQ